MQNEALLKHEKVNLLSYWSFVKSDFYMFYPTENTVLKQNVQYVDNCINSLLSFEFKILFFETYVLLKNICVKNHFQ